MESTGYKQSDDIEASKLPIMISVTAPSTLPAGYTFEAYVNDDKMRPFSCEVPEGGVTEGQTFMVPLPPSGVERINAPTGRWKDGLCDCFSVGICHPSLCCSMWCDQIMKAQIMTRMSLTWLGEPGQRISTKETFKVVVLLFVAYTIFSTALEMATMDMDPFEIPIAISVLKSLGGFFFSLYSIYSLCRTRQSVRAQYSIPEERCVGCEDLCCSLWCSCCTVSQMARHTGEYENYPGVCCSKTGHAEGTPLTV
mmetsp:Transcript_16027/g.40198  ORF Transcript_16027/g.40198 Transcript_16027/m.40198 type:complete len:253 (-) Transcript_16027:262-1020(-)|eukprot:CAMPEP_0116101680 /NCGR_PEP_ID=MMETSP0327-20121206/12939_1 /TAXON_ID=44447 /ORGANISM="Pseudo-nitzschia delicatissima, Strain B596" /LENGTH=252 /DNA_ID=CAMNT_0003593657 /DNA_START=118 /DNA_END=876 /DNA_ORIENTATION=-